NLAVNARDAMPHGGSLVIEVRDVDIEPGYERSHAGMQPGPYVMLTVSDTGAGMDPETLKHVFQPFFTTKPAGKGTGLGLATVYGIVRRSAGLLWSNGGPGPGTTFRICLPRAEGARAPAPAPVQAAPAASRGSETILLVEDEEGVRHLAQEVLE